MIFIQWMKLGGFMISVAKNFNLGKNIHLIIRLYLNTCTVLKLLPLI